MVKIPYDKVHEQLNKDRFQKDLHRHSPKRGVYPLYEQDISDDSDFINKLNSEIDVHYALAWLPERQRQVIRARMDGYTHKEIAEQLKTTENAIKQLKKRAKTTLLALPFEQIATI